MWFVPTSIFNKNMKWITAEEARKVSDTVKITVSSKIVIFDILVGHKNQSFVKPRQFLEFGSVVEIPKVIYDGNLNEEFIASVRRNDFGLKEGVICKGSTTRGAYRGKIWMCKIKTQEYLDKLKGRFGSEWEKYGE